MEISTETLLYSIAAYGILILLIHHYRKQNKKLKSQKQSQSTRYGQITEQYAPFLNSYPYDSKNFRFIGSPIDGIQFEEDKIIIIEIKTNTSRLTQRQENIKNQIQKGKVEWQTFKVG